MIRKGEIAIWNKMRVASSQNLFRKKYIAHENPQQIADNFVDEYWQERLAFDVDEQTGLILKVLQQSHDLRNAFIKSGFDLAASYQKHWRQNV